MGWEDSYPGQSGIDLRRAILAKLLGGSQDAMQNLGQTQMAGRVAVRNNPLAMLGPMLMGLAAYKGMDQVNADEMAATAPWRELQTAKLAEAKQQLKDQADFRAGAPAVALTGLPDGSPTVANAARQEQLQADPVAMLRAQAVQYAQQYQATRNPQFLAAAQKSAEMLKALQDKFGAPVTMMQNGQPVSVRFGDSGTQQVVQGLAPPPELTPVNQGDRTTFVDKLRTAPGTSFGVNMSPEQVDASKRGWANYGLAVNADRRAATNEGKPQLVQTDQGVFSVNPGTASGVPVTGPDGQPLVKAQRPTDPQLQAQGYFNRMTSASKIIGSLEDAGYTPGVGAAYTQGMGQLPVVGGLAGGAANWIGNKVQPAMGPYHQAMQDWVRAKLRKESGAVIGPKEMADEIITYFPQPGDSPAVIKQKAASRKTAEAAMWIQAGKGGPALAEDRSASSVDALLEKYAPRQ